MSRFDFFRAGWPLPVLLLLTVAVLGPTLDAPFYRDDGVMLYEAAELIERPALLFEPGYFNRVRPLRRLWLSGVTLAAEGVGGVGGDRSPVPFRVASLALHLVNVSLLVWLLLRFGRRLPRTLIAPRAARFAAWAGAAVFAVHWRGSEPVVYVSAVGVLLVMLGTLTTAHGLLTLGDAQPPRRRLVVAWCAVGAGLCIALGGGGYVMGALPLLAVVALWPRHEGAGPRARWRVMVTAAAGLGVVVAALVWQAVFIVRRWGEQASADLPAAGERWLTNWARMAVPSGLIDEWAAVALLILLPALLAWRSPASRRWLASRPCWLLLLAAGGGLAPFAFSVLGNHGRFLYVPLPAFLFAWSMVPAAAIFDREARQPATPVAAGWGIKGRVLIGAAVVWVIAHAVYLHRDMRDARDDGRALLQLVARVESLEATPGVTPAAYWFLGPDRQHAYHLLRAWHIVPADRLHYRRPPRSTLRDPALRWYTIAWHDETGYEVRRLTAVQRRRDRETR